MSALDTILDLVSWLFILSGSFFVIVGSVGTLRFPDFWARLHAASVTDSAGVLLLFAGMGMQAGLTLITFKLLIIVVFLFITGPTATHAIANAALMSGLRPKEAKGFTGVEPEPLTSTDVNSDKQE